MGLLRVLFAFSIVTAHTNGIFGFNLLNQQLAVCSFFIISGFYMSLVLEGKYKSYWLFISNRFLRIFPLYWTMLVLLLLFSLVKYFFHAGTPDNAIIHYLHYYPNTSPLLFIVDLLNFILRNITLIFTTDYINPGSYSPGYLLIQQAWTLQLELIFYLIVPFIMRLPSRLFWLFIVGEIIIVYGFIIPNHIFNTLSLTYIFFYYFLYFLLGMISYRLYKKLKNLKLPRALLITLFTSLILYLLAYNFIPFKITSSFFNAYDIPYYLGLVGLLPFIFLLSKNHVVDLFIGELSYPIYISHIFFIKLFNNIPFLNKNSWSILFLIIIVLAASCLLIFVVERPVDRLRKKRLVRYNKKV